jgi:hypothetical protein
VQPQLDIVGKELNKLNWDWFLKIGLDKCELEGFDRKVLFRLARKLNKLAYRVKRLPSP